MPLPRHPTVWLWGLALVALPIHRDAAVRLPWALPPAELATLPLLVYAVIRVRRGGLGSISIVDLGVLVWLAGQLAAGLVFFVRVGHDPVVSRELVVALYLGALYAAIRITANDGLVRWFPRLFALSATIAAALAITGVAASVAGVPTPFAFSTAEPYAYLGAAPRARALAVTPAMLASILSMALLLVIGTWRAPRGRRLAVIAVLTLGLLATFSKTIVCLLAGLVIVGFVTRRRSGRSLPAAVPLILVPMLAAVYALGSHVVILRDSVDRKTLVRASIIAEAPLTGFTIGAHRYDVLRTSYFVNKRTSLLAIRRTWPFGVGPGRQPSFATQLKAAGLYPASLRSVAPHSSYVGAAAEGGLAGFLGLAAFLGSLGTAVVRLAARDDVPPGFAAAALAAFVALLIEALATDIMHFRHYWWLAAVIAAWSARRDSLEVGDHAGAR